MSAEQGNDARRRKKTAGPKGSARFEMFFPAGLLLVIALTQLFLSTRTTLSPWKGGGFGMFAVVDAPGMRLLEGFGTLPDGREVRLDVFGSLDPGLTLRQQSLPNPRELAPMAHGLLTREWVPLSAQDRVALRRLKQENPDVVLPHEPFLELEEPLFRVRTSDDPPVQEMPPVQLQAVRLQWWRLLWNAETRQITTEPLGPEVRAQLPAPAELHQEPAPVLAPAS